MTTDMEMLTVSRAKAQFSKLGRSVLKSKKPAIIRTPAGLLQLAPYELPEVVPPAPRGTLRLSKREMRMHNSFGETL